MPKIFCVGFQKTGTSSMGVALENLGYSVGQAHGQILANLDWQSSDLTHDIAVMTVDIAQQFDALQDTPCCIIYKELDLAFPGSKFVLTLREPSKWLASYKHYFRDENNGLMRWMYGVDTLSGNEKHYCKFFNNKNAEIIEYFKDRPNDLLILNLEKGDGWYKLVRFLGDDFLKPFPHANPAGPWWHSLKNRQRRLKMTKAFYLLVIFGLFFLWLKS